MEAETLYDFVSNAEDELGFRRGSILKVLCVEDDPNWFSAELDGRRGLVPCNYISLKPHDWYVGKCSRQTAEERLLEPGPTGPNSYLQPDGAFILRQSEAGGSGFSLSVKQGSIVLHYKVLQDEAGLYFLWLVKFDSINKLIEHHRRNTISRTNTLTLVDRVPSNIHTNPGSQTEPQRVIGRQDFVAPDTSILSFQRGDVIEVLGVENDRWWRGKFPDGRTGLFPTDKVDPLPSIG